MMIEDNEEDLYTYFEEYVEMSGDDIHAKLRFEAFKKFAKYVCLSVRLFVTVIGCERVFVYAFACIWLMIWVRNQRRYRNQVEVCVICMSICINIWTYTGEHVK